MMAGRCAQGHAPSASLIAPGGLMALSEPGREVEFRVVCDRQPSDKFVANGGKRDKFVGSWWRLAIATRVPDCTRWQAWSQWLASCKG